MKELWVNLSLAVSSLIVLPFRSLLQKTKHRLLSAYKPLLFLSCPCHSKPGSCGGEDCLTQVGTRLRGVAKVRTQEALRKKSVCHQCQKPSNYGWRKSNCGGTGGGGARREELGSRRGRSEPTHRPEPCWWGFRVGGEVSRRWNWFPDDFSSVSDSVPYGR